MPMNCPYWLPTLPWFRPTGGPLAVTERDAGGAWMDLGPAKCHEVAREKSRRNPWVRVFAGVLDVADSRLRQRADTLR